MREGGKKKKKFGKLKKLLVENFGRARANVTVVAVLHGRRVKHGPKIGGKIDGYR